MSEVARNEFHRFTYAQQRRVMDPLYGRIARAVDRLRVAREAGDVKGARRAKRDFRLFGSAVLALGWDLSPEAVAFVGRA